MMDLQLRKILAVLSKRKHLVYADPFKLNIVGVRADSTTPNSFDDTINVFYKDDRDRWHIHSWPATTDPGTYWLHSPSHPQGTAILAQGQYVDAYKIDRHRGKYYALCQRHKPVTVIRDYDRNAVLDFYNGERMSGMFGINIHRASSSGTTKQVQRYSAGCQVFANANDFDDFMQLCEMHRRLHDNYFTYSLIDNRAMKRADHRRFLARAGIMSGLAGLAGLAIYPLTQQSPE